MQAAVGPRYRRQEWACRQTARWIVSDNDQALQKFISLNRSTMAEDKNGDPVFLVRNDWSLNRAIDEAPEVKFLKVRERS